MLTGITITGADDRVDPNALIDLSLEFPFVEWGILASPQREGTSRYPSREWIERLDTVATVRAGRRGPRIDVDRDDTLVQLSLHLCGEYTRNALDNRFVFVAPPSFARVQLNGWKPMEGAVFTLKRIALAFDVAFVLQVRSPEMIAPAIADAGVIGRRNGLTGVLLDASGGRGIRPDAYPSVRDDSNVPVGYAGGIDPDNVLETLSRIGARHGDFWIDMESGVRTNDMFDLALVRRVLERVAFCFRPGRKPTEQQPAAEG